LLKSSIYLIVNLIEVCIFFYLASFIDYAPSWARYIIWPLYWFAQGAIMTGLWVIAHECGHQAFCDSKSINNAIGFVLHSLLLVPYHAWRISHSQHHKSTSHMERDQVFIPALKENSNHILNDTPIFSFFQLLIMWTVGWPGYLLLNVQSQKQSRRANHFEPDSPLFEEKDRSVIILSDVGILLALSLFTAISQIYGFWFFTKYYFIPYLWVNFWLVTITYLQHTDQKIPHYRGDEWTFIRGGLATMDRDFGIFNYFHHHISDSHVAHHLFSTMPHYHALEATPYLKKFLGKYYLQETDHWFVSLWKTWRTCHFVDSTGDVVWYQYNKIEKQK